MKSYRSVLLGVVASGFFASTFVLNRVMSLNGGTWLWTASLRYLFTLPLLVAIVAYRRGLGPLLVDLRRHWLVWLLWSTVGFGLFYAPLCFASAYAPAWLVSGTWQLTIVAGSLLAPWLKHSAHYRLPLKSLAISGCIIIGIILMQFGRTGSLSGEQILANFLPVLLAAFAYPLGNRMMMAHCGERIDTFQRILGMTIASLPLWIVLAGIGWAISGWSAPSVIGQSLIVALFSGVIATALFFSATNQARHAAHHLAAVEATQSLEVVFSLLGELLVLNIVLPGPVSLVGMVIVIAGMVAHSWLVRQAA